MNSNIQDDRAMVSPVWSFWKTIGISVFVIVGGNFLIQYLIIGGHILFATFQKTQFAWSREYLLKFTDDLIHRSSFISESILVSDVISIIMILYFTALKDKGNMKNYLGFNPVKPVPFLAWQIIMVAFYFGANYIVSQSYLEEPAFMKFMKNIFNSQSVLDLFLIILAVVVVVPLFEEIMFRGFMYTGILQSRVGIFGAILIPSAFWSLIHIQYEVIWILFIFVMGVLFTLARYFTGSIYTVIGMHAVNNFFSIINILQP